MTKIVLLFMLAAGLAGGRAASVQAQMQQGTICPVMQGHPAKEKFSADYEGRRIYFCCRSCVRKFKRHPEKYLQPAP